MEEIRRKKEKDMSTISKKKSFWKEFYKYYKDDIKFVLTIFAAIAGVVFISFIAIFSSHLFDDFFREADFISKVLFIILVTVIIIAMFSFAGFAALITSHAIIYFISQTKAIKQYVYLPLTVNEVRLMIDEGVITTDKDYTYYLTDKLTYKYSGDNHCLKFTDEDMEKIINTYEEVFNKPLILDSEYYKKNRYSWVPDSIPDVIWSTRCPFNYKDEIDKIYRKDGREAGANPVVFVHKDNSFEKIENANYIYIDNE